MEESGGNAAEINRFTQRRGATDIFSPLLKQETGIFGLKSMRNTII